MGSFTFQEQRIAVANIRYFVSQRGASPDFYMALTERLKVLGQTWETIELSDYERLFLNTSKERLLRELARLSQRSK